MACPCPECQLRPGSPYHTRRSTRCNPAISINCFYDGSAGYGHQGSWIDGHDYPAPSMDALRLLQDKGAECRSSASRLDLEEAFGLAHQALGENKWTTVPCLDEYPSNDVHYSTGDLPFMVFDDLDQKLFRSMLKGNVYLRWANLPPGVYATTSRPWLHGNPRITIKLNTSAAKYPAFTLGTLLHQMVHAYYLQCCGHKNKKVAGSGHNLRHNEEFRSLYQSIRDHFLPGEATVWKAARLGAPGQKGLSPCYYHPEPGSSNCYCCSETVKSKEIDSWRKTAMNMMMTKSVQKALNECIVSNISPQGFSSWYNENNMGTPFPLQRPSSSSANIAGSCTPYTQDDYLTVQYGDQRYPILKQGLYQMEGLWNTPFARDGNLFFPSNAPAGSFDILHSYLTEATFAPTRTTALSALEAHTNFEVRSFRGCSPPIILASRLDTPPYLASSISAYKLATIFQFEPFKATALDRMYMVPYSLEDPVALLQKIYGSEPKVPADDPLRVWVKKWLKIPVPRPDSPRNIDFLQLREDVAARFHGLVQAQPDLQNDMRAAGLQHPLTLPQQPYQPQQGWPSVYPELATSSYPGQQPLPPPNPFNPWPNL